MSDWQEKARKILDSLAKEHGSEAFVSDGYAYYCDAEEAIATAMKHAHEQGRREGWKDAVGIVSFWESADNSATIDGIIREIRALDAEQSDDKKGGTP
jgi:glucan phosphorylase